MKRVYLVWFRPENEAEDKIRGVALNWEKAERMAETLALHLRTVLDSNYTYGVKSYVIGDMPYDLVSDDGCFSTWGPDNFGDNS